VGNPVFESKILLVEFHRVGEMCFGNHLISRTLRCQFVYMRFQLDLRCYFVYCWFLNFYVLHSCMSCQAGQTYAVDLLLLL